jgi:ubiquinone/menaquinone biosynthesis C-methylase UbiE
MMTGKRHDDLVAAQFGPQATAYITSAVHAQGDDLRQLAEIVGAGPRGRALDLGCGGGHVSFHVAPHVAEVVAYDLSAEMLAAVTAGARERGLDNVVTVQGAAEALPFPDGSFDAVLSRYSAHHWDDLDAGLREARRVLRAGGRAVFVDVVTPGSPLRDTFLQSIELLRDPSHVRNYTVDEWHRTLRAAGFVPHVPTLRRVRLDFSAWIARMRTPETHVRAIRSLQGLASHELVDAFAIEPDGTFTVDAMTLEATPA